MLNQDEAKRGVVRVRGGRGFVVDVGGMEGRLIIMAAHCLRSKVLPCASFAFSEEFTYQRLLSQLGKKPTVWAECLFIDPIADIAVLGPPDNQALRDEWDAYEAMVDEALPLPVLDAPEQGRAWLLSLKGGWFQCDLSRHPSPHGSLWISGAEDNILGGMSGSPILTDDGAAIGVMCTSDSANSEASTEGGPNPRLASHLPGWLLQEIGLAHIRPRSAAGPVAEVRRKKAAKRKG